MFISAVSALAAFTTLACSTYVCSHNISGKVVEWKSKFTSPQQHTQDFTQFIPCCIIQPEKISRKKKPAAFLQFLHKYTHSPRQLQNTIFTPIFFFLGFNLTACSLSQHRRWSVDTGLVELQHFSCSTFIYKTTKKKYEIIDSKESIINICSPLSCSDTVQVHQLQQVEEM